MLPLVTALVRTRTGEVLKIAKQRPNGTIQMFTEADPTVWTIALDPTLTDGDHVRDQSKEEAGPLRTLGFAKHYVTATNTIRNSTKAEIDTYATGEAEDEKDQDVESVKAWMKNHPQHRKMVQLMFKAMNQIRRDAGLAPWTKPQISNFIANNVSRED